MATLTIQTLDNKDIVIARDSAFTFQTIKSLVTDTDANIVPLPVTPSHIFNKMMNFVEHCYGNPEKEEEWMCQVSGLTTKTNNEDWMSQVNKQKIEFFSMAQEANNLDYKYLLKAIAKKMAEILTGMTAEEMKEYLEFEQNDMNMFYSGDPHIPFNFSADKMDTERSEGVQGGEHCESVPRITN